LIQRETQAPAYWGDEFTITSEDLQYLSTLLVEEELPRSAEELGRMLVLHRCQQEEALIGRVMSKGTPYQPKRSYAMGEQVVFPALGYLVGEVVGLRPGHNPEHDSFQVIRVKFQSGETREFAAEFTGEHPLNREAQAVPAVGSDELRSAEELATLHSAQVGRILEQHLESEAGFVRLAGKWFIKDLLVDVHVGHLNLAEAVLDMAGGGPLPTEALLGDLELPEEITPQLRIFSLNYALQEDMRFDEVGPAGQVLWFLHRLEPEDVQSVPLHLRYQPIEYDPALLTSEMLSLERELDDEWSDLESPQAVQPVTIALLYPHWKSGTLPISSRLAHVFPTGRTRRIRFTFVDGNTGAETPGWVMREQRYVSGLKEWYKTNDVPVGAYLVLAQGEKPGSVSIRQRAQRPRREWVRVALPVEGRLTFEMRKELISCEYDERIIVTEEDAEAMELVRSRTQEQGLSLKQLTARVFPELAKLSPQGTVHAATLYSAVNVVMRTPPGPLLAELVSGDMYMPVGDNYWVLRGPSGV
jgi:hypothetical protein